MKIISKICSLLVVVALLVGSFAFVTPHTASAAVGSWVKGASIDPNSPGEYSTEAYRASVRDLKAMGANTVSLVVPYYQSNTGASDIQNGWNTPTDAALADGITYAKSIGLNVVLKPHMEVYDGQWRANISAWDRNAWFANYSAKLNHLGDIGKQNGASGIVVGSELISMATYTSNGDNTQRWSTLIDSLRGHFNGYLTYSANWGSGDFAEEVPHIGFWNKLDYIGISGYYPLAEGQWNPSIDALKASWDNWNNWKIKPIADQYGKQVIFTELGYKSVDNAHNQPWNSGMGGGYNAQEQVNDYEAFFGYWNDRSHIAGLYVWDWNSDPASGGQGNIDYTPQNKPAYATIQKWFGTNTSEPTNPNPQPQPGAWNATASTTGTTVNSPVTLNVNFSNTGSVSNAIVDIEVYNSSDKQVFQFATDNQTLGTKSYSTNWTPTAAGTYTVRVGVFNNNWSQNYYWNHNLATITVGNGQTNPTPQPGNWTASATNNGTQANSPIALNAKVTTTGSVSNAIVDLEVYDSSDKQVFQKAFDNQSFNSNVQKSYDASWTPTAAGTYTVRLGVFNNDWTKNYYWNHAVSTITVTSGQTTTTPPTSTTTPPTTQPGSTDTNIWWPSDNGSVNGVTPLKAMLTNRSVSDYKMYWQVDGGGLVEMYNSNEDYPHKESWVDFTGWNWKGQGPYTLNFVSKDMSGTILSQKAINIYVR